MRISTATTLVCSTLATVAFYQGFAALFPHLAHPDDESASNAKKDGTTDQTNGQKLAIASPETMPLTKVDARSNAPAKAEQAGAGGKRTVVSTRNLPTVNVPPTLRSMPNRFAERALPDVGSTPTVPDVALPEMSGQNQPDLIDQGRANVSTAQSLPFTSINTSLTDVKGHWAESYIESLAAKGVARGFRDGSFRPDTLVTSQQFVLMTQKAFTASPISYTDLQQLHLDRAPTRADAAAFIYQTLAKAESAPLTMAVQVSGAVPRPGIYAIANGSRIDAPANAGVPTVSRAIQQAGGALEGANLNQVQIHRIGETSARQVINVDVRQLLKTGDRSRDIVLQQGDKLFIPAAATAATTNPISTLPTPERSISLVESTK
ncbi:MAG: S-layer homology domain-containing protein [Verrucomicrobia bacterium]|nr:S-layer homology domain-containing protein [Leptolyngbya sp. ES-bin-22]